MKEVKNHAKKGESPRGGLAFSEDSPNPAERILALTKRARSGWKSLRELDDISQKLEDSWEELKRSNPKRYKILRDLVKTGLKRNDGWH